MPKENASYKCLTLVILDSVVKVKKKYYPKTVLAESKHEIKKTKMENLINDEIEWSSCDNETESDNDPTVNLAMRLIMNLTMNNLLINLRIKAIFY